MLRKAHHLTNRETGCKLRNESEEGNMRMDIMVTLLESDGERSRYRVVGTPTAQKWADAVRPGEEPWCEVTVYADGTLGSFGGEVWPGAWPELFLHTPTRYNGGAGYRVTERGRELLASA